MPLRVNMIRILMNGGFSMDDAIETSERILIEYEVQMRIKMAYKCGWCKEGEHDACPLRVRLVSGKKVQCGCECHSEENARSGEEREPDLDGEGDGIQAETASIVRHLEHWYY